MLIRKHLSLDDVNLKLEGDTGRFAGYASVFGGVDSNGDTIVKGAFDYTLRTNGKPKMFLEHSWATGASGAGLLPIGKFDVAKEDDHGLYLEGSLTPGMSLSADVRAAMKHGTIDGLSIGGFVKKGDYEETKTGRVIRKWSHLVEVSVVSMPADSAARIEAGSIKSSDMAEAIDEIDSIRTLERFLRDAGGLSKGAATALVARAKVLLAGEGDPAANGSTEAKAMQAIFDRLARIPQLNT